MISNGLRGTEQIGFKRSNFLMPYIGLLWLLKRRISDIMAYAGCIKMRLGVKESFVSKALDGFEWINIFLIPKRLWRYCILLMLQWQLKINLNSTQQLSLVCKMPEKRSEAFGQIAQNLSNWAKAFVSDPETSSHLTSMLPFKDLPLMLHVWFITLNPYAELQGLIFNVPCLLHHT